MERVQDIGTWHLAEQCLLMTMMIDTENYKENTISNMFKSISEKIINKI